MTRSGTEFLFLRLSRMKFVRNLNIGTRVNAAFGALLALIVAVGALGAQSVGKVFAGAKAICEDRAIPLQQLGAINNWMLEDRLLLRDLMDRPDPAEIKRLDDELRAHANGLDKTWQAYLATSLTPDCAGAPTP